MSAPSAGDDTRPSVRMRTEARAVVNAALVAANSTLLPHHDQQAVTRARSAIRPNAARRGDPDPLTPASERPAVTTGFSGE